MHDFGYPTGEDGVILKVPYWYGMTMAILGYNGIAAFMLFFIISWLARRFYGEPGEGKLIAQSWPAYIRFMFVYVLLSFVGFGVAFIMGFGAIVANLVGMIGGTGGK